MWRLGYRWYDHSRHPIYNYAHDSLVDKTSEEAIAEFEAMLNLAKVKLDNVAKDTKIRADSTFGKLVEAFDRLAAEKNVVKEGIKKRAYDLKDAAKEKAYDIKEGAKDAKDYVSNKANDLKEAIKDKAHDLNEGVRDKASDLKEGAKDKAHDWKETIKEKAHDMKEGAEEVGEKLAEGAERIKDKAYEVKEGVKDKAIEFSEALKETAQNIWAGKTSPEVFTLDEKHKQPDVHHSTRHTPPPVKLNP